MRDLIKKTETIFEKTKNFATRNSHIIMPVLMVGFFMLVQNETILADDGAAFAKTMLKDTLSILIKVMFIGTGILSLVFGTWELGSTLMGQNPDAKNKAIAGFGVGIVLIALGIGFLTKVDAMVAFFIS